ncbi:MAG: dTDP-4-dehydrorhamnose 3,5-epimerase [Bacteroidia bacterium]|nr:dTDP-4-dehydrorhamnose 3,5-epimerase [Bacteroidia bacterium]MDW8236376.1 dTDP-4-dehydrorhamnose 3,5-epimerase [Bacteroidia bacterium]
MSHSVEKLPLRDALVIQLPKFQDDRGFFAEAFRAEVGEKLQLPPFLQDNLSYSHRNVLRGLHFQRPPHAQAKLVCVLRGHIQDVIVDLRPTSPTYKHWYGIELRADREKLTWLYVPVGFAHGFIVLSDEALVWYRCSAYYSKEADGGVRWNDPDLGIAWQTPTGAAPTVSAKDAALPLLRDLENPFAGL